MVVITKSGLQDCIAFSIIQQSQELCGEQYKDTVEYLLNETTKWVLDDVHNNSGLCQ